jgi:N-acetylmuramoyl-L-alanine amidase
MPKIHVTQQGEHISGLAEKFGFGDYRTIWDHPQNADLKKRRQNPNVLFPGDQVFIPDKEMKTVDAATGKKHVLKIVVQKLTLRVVLRTIDDEPMSGVSCELEVMSKKETLVADDQGLIKKAISKQAHDGDLIVADTLIRLQIGDLDPVEEQSGQLARLTNLGYYLGTPGDLDKEQFRCAVEEFQCDHKKSDGLQITGDCDHHTQQVLLKVHGC